MPKKRILTVNCEIPGGEGEYVDLDSKVSLLDWDIILFWPDLSHFGYSPDTYLGKPCLSDDRSFSLRQQSEHWRREIHDAFEAGKTIIVFLTDLTEVYIATGERQHSGTGRNQKTTRIVDLHKNYDMLPLNFEPISACGKGATLTKDGALIGDYWKEFAADSEYRIRFESKVAKPLLVTKTGSKCIGALIRSKTSRGSILLLPHLDLNREEFYKETDEGDFTWTPTGTKFGKRLVHSIVEIEKVLASAGGSTPMPEWAGASEFDTPKESDLRQKMLRIDTKIDSALKTREKYGDQLASAGILRKLLYENGAPLEHAIIAALELMGFKAENYKDSESEFDVVFSSEEGRFLGEAEGRDNKAIAIDKLRQLEMNIHEDFDRDQVEVPARGVLFGNAQRLLPLSERGEFFTEKCLIAAKRSSTALVRTPDLFTVAQYLSANDDKGFSEACRNAILTTSGAVVAFPEPPSHDSGPTDVINSKEA